VDPLHQSYGVSSLTHSLIGIQFGRVNGETVSADILKPSIVIQRAGSLASDALITGSMIGIVSFQRISLPLVLTLIRSHLVLASDLQERNTPPSNAKAPQWVDYQRYRERGGDDRVCWVEFGILPRASG
jgi:hypothetical protein